MDRADVVIIGSGPGGSVTALELSRAGRDVLVLEEGDRFDLGSYGQPPDRAMQKLYRRRGMNPFMGPVSIGYVEGCCVGGSSEINSGIWQRTPDETLCGWENRYGLLQASSEDLEPHFQEGEKMLEVCHPPDWPPSTEVFHRGAKAMGWRVEKAPRMAKNCVQTNACACGCPTGAKQGMTRSYIPLAEKQGARIKPGCRAVSLVKKGGRINQVIAKQRREDGALKTVRISADAVFVCAGPTETPALLRRSGIKRNVGNSLKVHPMLKVVARFKEEMNASGTVLPLLLLKEFWPDVGAGGAFFTPGHLALLFSENWPWIRDRMRWHDHMAAYHVAVPGTGAGCLRPLPGEGSGNFMWYRLTRRDLANLSRGLARLSALLFAAGALELYPGVYGLPCIRTPEEADRLLSELLPLRGLSLTTVHAFGTCPIGERQDLCAADSFGKVHGFENLFVNDASMLPDATGVSPQGSIVALARRNALHFIKGKR